LLTIALLALSPLVNDILVIERTPELLYPYGVGHPHTLRIAGIIPVIYFVISFGLAKLRPLLKTDESFINFFSVLYIFLALMIFNNWNLYYEQPTNKIYSNLITIDNGLYALDIVNFINTHTIHEAGVSPQIIEDGRFSYFINKDVKISVFAPKNYSDAIKKAKTNKITIYYVFYNQQLANQLISRVPPSGLQVNILSTPDTPQGIYTIVLKNTK
jgi:hypothetical protein